MYTFRSDRRGSLSGGWREESNRIQSNRCREQHYHKPNLTHHAFSLVFLSFSRHNKTIQADDEPKIDPKYEENATTHGLSHPTSLKYVPIRVAQLCLRAAYLHQGNALAASGKDDQAREAYQKVLPLLENEPRCGRVDWERSSIFVNVGNTYSRQGEFTKANEQYEMAEKLAQDHLESEDGSKVDGLGMKLVANRARAFALKKAGKEDEAKSKLREVLELQKQFSEEQEKKQKEQEEAAKAAAKQAEAQQQ